MESFRAKIVPGSSSGPSEKISRVFQMNPEELSKWLRKTAFTFCYEIPETDEGLETEIRDVLMEVDDSTDGKWEVYIIRIQILLGLYLGTLNPKPYKRIASECPLVLPARQCCKEGLLCPQLTLAIHITHCRQYRV